MKIVDAQIHIWAPDGPKYPWAKGVMHNQGPSYTAEQAIALMDAAGVTGTVLVTPSWIGNDNSYSTDSVVKYPGRFRVMGRFDYTAPDALGRLDRWRDQPGMVGIRATLADPLTIALVQDKAFDPIWTRMSDLGLPFMVYAPQVIPIMGQLARRFPDLRIIADHSSRWARGPKDAPAWTDLWALLELAKLPNMAVKVSSLPSFTTQPYPFPNLHPHIRAIYDAFGPERMMWGSDVTRLDCTYEENIRLFSEALDFLSDSDRAWIFSKSLAKWCDVDL